MAVFLVLSLVGCGTEAPVTTGVEVDEDGDGWTVSAGDCDDTNATIFPQAEEIPFDGIDQDCDGQDLLDGDGDGFDAADSGGTDCDDQNAAIHPDADELCETVGVDDNCNGLSEEYPAADGELYYLDQDGDDFGDADQATLACEYAPGLGMQHYAENGLFDCDDTDATVNPSSSESWYDGVDQDCDGNSDYDADGDGEDEEAFGGSDCDDSDAEINSQAEDICWDGIDQDCDDAEPVCADTIGVDAADGVFYGTDAGDKLGIEIAGGHDLSGDGSTDIAASGKSSVSSEDQIWIFSTATSGTQTLDDAWSTLQLSELEAFAPVHDLDGDGYADLMVAEGEHGDGHLRLYQGPLSGALDRDDADDVVSLNGHDSDFVSIISTGDLNGDGFNDAAVGLPHWDDCGGVRLFSGAAISVGEGLDGFATITGCQADYEGTGIGSMVTSGDLNSDGFADLLVSETWGGWDGGDLYGVLGPIDESVRLEDAEIAVESGIGDDHVAQIVGDSNGDGHADVLVDSGSDIEVFYGPFSSGDDLDKPDIVFVSRLVASHGDLDGDGRDDYLMFDSGADDGDVENVGAVYVFLSAEEGTLTTSDSDLRIMGSQAGQRVGYSHGFVGDTDGDGTDNIATGSPWDDTSGNSSGAVWLFGL